MTDNELFELCKETYGKTGWETPEWYDLDPDGKPEEYLATTEDKIDDNDYIPYYTSDYLLEKLQNFGVRVWYENKVDNLAAWWASIRGDDGLYLYNAETPLKSVLKLTLALKEAGEL
jgi:hypothetical protein